MSGPLKLGLFAFLVAGVLGGAALAGAAIDPDVRDGDDHRPEHGGAVRTAELTREAGDGHGH